MWKKEDGPSAQPSTDPRAPGVGSSQKPSVGGVRATIGPSITIKGDVTGKEDLLIQGEVEGSVTLEKHMVSVGSEGRVKADIVGRVITIEGKVEGDLTAQEQIILRGSAQVHGDIKAPRVVLEDGATFRGLVDMGTTSTSSSSAQPRPAPEKKAGSASSDGGSDGAKGKDAASGATRASA